ncbi:11009_t:CDS:1, partial [Scutellospora calospora]
ITISKNKTVTILTRIQEHPNTFHADNNILICLYYNKPVEWRSKLTVDNHCNSNMHKSNKSIFEAQEHPKKQISIQT